MLEQINLLGAVITLAYFTSTTMIFVLRLVGKADWGAKSVKRRVDNLIQSSEIAFRGRPLSRLLRTLRDSHRR